MGRTGGRIGGAIGTCLSGSTRKRCIVPRVEREPVLLVKPPNMNGARVVRRVTERYGVNLITCAVARRAHRSTMKLPFVGRHRCSKGDCSIARCAVDRVVTDICRGVRTAKLGRNVLFVSRVGYISRALTPAVLRFLRYGAFNGRTIPGN